MGLLMAVNPIVSQHVGAGEHARIGQVVRQALWNALGVGLLAMVVANLGALVLGHAGHRAGRAGPGAQLRAGHQLRAAGRSAATGCCTATAPA
jgi:hypothetical protein